MTRLMATCIVLVACVTVLAAEEEAPGDAKKQDPVMCPRVKIETTLGDIVIELNAEKAPITVANFIQYTQDKFYDQTIFHRVMKDFMVQGGGFTPEMDKKTEGLRDPIKLEADNGLSNVRGTIAMARTRAPDSATAQFFINVVDNSMKLDYPRMGGYAVFGEVVEGMDTVDKIRDTPVAEHPKYGGGRQATVPVEPVAIKSVRLIGDFDRAKFDAAVKKIEEAAKAKEEKQMAEFAKKVDEAKAKGVKTESGLICYDIVAGDGPTPKADATVEVHYTGWLTNGTKFDSSVDRGKPFSFSLTGGVIPGWLEGVATMKVGSKRTLVIPPELGYGSRGSGAKIPPDSTLVFDVELLAIK